MLDLEAISVCDGIVIQPQPILLYIEAPKSNGPVRVLEQLDAQGGLDGFGGVHVGRINKVLRARKIKYLSLLIRKHDGGHARSRNAITRTLVVDDFFLIFVL